MLTSITCPSCEASYRVPADRLGAGRKVRCQRCRDEWYATPDHETAPVDAPEAAAEAEIETEAPAVVAQPLEAPVVVVTAPEPILSLEEASEIEVIERPERIDGAAPKPARGAPRGVGGYLARRRRTSAAG
ncbi:MJ0042-type zinc finger domain-containing protein, partial [Chenggangzhangella methanolivorans]